MEGMSTTIKKVVYRPNSHRTPSKSNSEGLPFERVSCDTLGIKKAETYMN